MNRTAFKKYHSQIRARGAVVYWELSEADRRTMMEVRRIRFDPLAEFEMWRRSYPHFFPAFRYPWR